MNFLLDTCTVSELRKGDRADEGLVQWARDVRGAFFISAITLLELEIGVRRLERRDAAQGAILRTWLDEQVRNTFRDRVLAFDAAAALACAGLHVPDPRAERDAMIASTAIVHHLPLVTRNIRDFKGMKALTLINPWS